MLSRLSTAAVVVCLLSTGTVTLGQTEQDQKGKRKAGEKLGLFERMDKNNDGVLSAEEIPKSIKGITAKFDANGDGEVTRAEMASSLKEQLPKTPNRPGKAAKNAGQGQFVFDRLDRNGDGKLTREEAPEAMREYFSRIDSDGDGAVSPKELEAAVAMRARMGNGPGRRNNSPKQLFFQQDLDADGRVTREEAKGKLAEEFNALDTDGNDKLDPREVANTSVQSPPGS